MMTFEGKSHGIAGAHLAAKLLGKTNKDKLLSGYARLPGIIYNQAAVSARLPKITKRKKGFIAEIEVQNFGQVISDPTKLDLEVEDHSNMIILESTEIRALKPFEKMTVKIKSSNEELKPWKSKVRISIYPQDQLPVYLHGEIKVKTK